MLTIRLKRTGRKGHAQFRVVVQDSRFSPTSGRVVAYVGSYDPHTKVAALDGEKISSYMEKGAQPSDRVARLLKKEGIKLPAWVKLEAPKKQAIRNPEKLRRNRPAEEKVEAKPVEEEVTSDAPAEEAAPSKEAEPAAEQVKPEEPAEEKQPEEVEASPQPEAKAEAKAPAQKPEKED